MGKLLQNIRWVLAAIGVGALVIGCGAFTGPPPFASPSSAISAPPPSPPQTVRLQPFQMTTPQMGSALGQFPHSLVDQVLFTQDGGARWMARTPTGIAPKRALCGVPGHPRMAWVATVHPGKSMRVYRTVDGGQKWTASSPIPTPYGGGLLSLDCVNSTTGFLEVTAAGNAQLSGSLFRTRDGGQTWTQMATTHGSAAPSKGNLPFSGGLYFANRTTGWLTGGSRGGAPAGMGGPGFIWLYRTSNGGRTWAHQSLPVPAALQQDFTSVRSLRFDGAIGEAVIAFSHRGSSHLVLFHTSDGGTAWIRLRLPPGTQQVQFEGPKIGWSIAQHMLYRTNHGGKIWTRVAALPAGTSWWWTMLNAQDGWIAMSSDRGQKTQLYRTQNGGQSWTALHPMAFPKAGHGE